MNEFPNIPPKISLAVDTETTGLGYRDVPVGVSIAAPGQSWYLRWGHVEGGNNCTKEAAVAWLRDTFKDRPLVFHNAPFDVRMLDNIGVDVTQCDLHDTMYMAALLDERSPSFALGALGKQFLGREKSNKDLVDYCADKFGGKPTHKAQAPNFWRADGNMVEEYACADAEIARDLAFHLYPLLAEENLIRVYDVERQMINIVHKMYKHGVRADLNRADEVKNELEKRLLVAREQLDKLAPNINPNSGNQVGEFFLRQGIPLEYTAQGNISVTRQWLARQTHPAAQLVMAVRKMDHMVGTFVDGYIFDNVDDQGVIHGIFHPMKSDEYGTVSGRFSSGGGLNLQNVPARDEEVAPLIRSLFIPWSPKHQWCKIDLSQIEYRCFAHYAGGQLRDTYLRNPAEDFHQMVADMVGIERRPAKTVNFGILYGMGENKMARELGLPLDEARALLQAIHRRVPEMRALYDRAMRRAAQRGYIYTLLGRRRRFLNSEGRAEFTHKALNALLQGTAADIIKLDMIDVASTIDWDSTRLHLTVHDELDFSVPLGEEGLKEARRLKGLMEVSRLSVPILADMSLGPNWGYTNSVS